MWIPITSLATVILLCLFIAISIYLGTVAAMVITAALCTALLVSVVGLVIGVLAILIEAAQRRRELIRG